MDDSLRDGIFVDLDGDDLVDFRLSFVDGDADLDRGDQLVISAPFVIASATDSASGILIDPGPAPAPNSILGEFEGIFVTSFTNGPGAAPFNSAGLSLSNLEFGDIVTATEVIAGSYDSFGTSTGFFQGNFNGVDQAVLYDSIDFTDLLTLGNTFVAVFDIPGGSPFVATIDLDGDFDADGNLSGFAVAGSSGFDTLANSVPEPASAALLALGGLALLRRRNAA